MAEYDQTPDLVLDVGAHQRLEQQAGDIGSSARAGYMQGRIFARVACNLIATSPEEQLGSPHAVVGRCQV